MSSGLPTAVMHDLASATITERRRATRARDQRVLSRRARAASSTGR
jgi:hypothetical protein